MRKNENEKFVVHYRNEPTRYHDYYTRWVEWIVKKYFPHLIRKKTTPPYVELWQEVARKSSRKRSKKI